MSKSVLRFFRPAICSMAMSGNSLLVLSRGLAIYRDLNSPLVQFGYSHSHKAQRSSGNRGHRKQDKGGGIRICHKRPFERETHEETPVQKSERPPPPKATLRSLAATSTSGTGPLTFRCVMPSFLWLSPPATDPISKPAQLLLPLQLSLVPSEGPLISD
jgi:hypothetical protein